MDSYQPIIRFDWLKSTGSEILVKTVEAIHNYKYVGWSSRFHQYLRTGRVAQASEARLYFYIITSS